MWRTGSTCIRNARLQTMRWATGRCRAQKDTTGRTKVAALAQMAGSSAKDRRTVMACWFRRDHAPTRPRMPGAAPFRSRAGTPLQTRRCSTCGSRTCGSTFLQSRTSRSWHTPSAGFEGWLRARTLPVDGRVADGPRIARRHPGPRREAGTVPFPASRPAPVPAPNPACPGSCDRCPVSEGRPGGAVATRPCHGPRRKTARFGDCPASPRIRPTGPRRVRRSIGESCPGLELTGGDLGPRP